MSYKANYIIIAVMLLSFASCSQSRTGIYKTYSFYKINTPGTIPVDENGRPIGRTHDTARSVYFETVKGEKPQIKELIINGNYYHPILTQLNANTEEAGILLKTNKPVVIKGGSDKQLWKVEKGNKIEGQYKEKFKKDFIYLSVQYKGRNAMRIIKMHQELIPDLHY